MVSDTVIQHYEDTVKNNKIAPHTMHNLALDCAVLLLKGLSEASHDGSVNKKQANNIWNFIVTQLKAKGYDPYTFKIDGFKELLNQMEIKPLDS